MPHPTPTAAKSASPPLRGWGPRGSGQGVGGIALALTLLATPTTAQIIPTGTPAADILLSQAIAEQRLYLTCTALDGQTHSFIADLWARDVIAATATLTANTVAPEAIAAFTAAAATGALLPPPDTPFEAVRQFCASQPDWVENLNRMQMLRLETTLPGAFE